MAGIESESPVEKLEGDITCWSKHEASENELETKEET